MEIEGGSSNREVQSQEIQQANSEQNELNQADHKRSGEELEANSTIDNEGERKQIEGREEATDSKDGNVSRLDDAETIEDDSRLSTEAVPQSTTIFRSSSSLMSPMIILTEHFVHNFSNN
jgi:hypothetical protein